MLPHRRIMAGMVRVEQFMLHACIMVVFKAVFPLLLSLGPGLVVLEFSGRSGGRDRDCFMMT
jgi:hypothetical protein